MQNRLPGNQINSLMYVGVGITFATMFALQSVLPLAIAGGVIGGLLSWFGAFVNTSPARSSGIWIGIGMIFAFLFGLQHVIVLAIVGAAIGAGLAAVSAYRMFMAPTPR